MPKERFVNFDLLILPAGEGYRAHVVDSPVGQAQAAFALPFTADELQAFTRLSGRVTRHLKQTGDSTVPLLDVQSFGSRLYAAVFAGEVGQSLVRSLDTVARDGMGLRIRLRLNDTPELADLPWEYLYAGGPYVGFLALSDATPVVRYLELPRTTIPLRVQPPLRILALVADPQDVPKLAVEREWRLLHDALDPLQGCGLVRLERLAEPTLLALQRRLHRSADDVHILHFIGHGGFDERKGWGGLFFEDGQRNHHFVTGDDLSLVLQGHETLRLVFLNACEGARGSGQNLFAGVAQTLLRQGIPAVLAMQFAVGDAAAIALAQEFYRSLAGGRPVDTAVREARVAVKTLGNEMEWGTPVLFSRSSDNRILVLPEGDARLAIDRRAWEPETMLIPGGPFVMGSDPDAGVSISETPAHEVRLPDFRIGRYPVTVGEFALFVKDTKAAGWVNVAQAAGWFDLEPPEGKLDHPATYVGWRDALAYCEWLSTKTGRRYRLPSEAEWEKAAGWSTEISSQKRRYPWGEAWEDECCNAGTSETTPVTAHPMGASAYGIEDLLGNVQEWTCSRWGSQPQRPDYGYPYRPEDGREIGGADELSPQQRWVHRGGSYNSQPAGLSCTARGQATPDSRVAWRGFRVVMVIQQDVSENTSDADF